VLLHGVVRRTKEIGIRVALGAQAHDVLAMVFRHGLKLVGLGIVAGLIGAFWAGHLMRSLLFEVSPDDPAVLAAVPGILLCVALFACWLPARRAARVDPMVALRAE
jgi:putative ABC transport system permease protein